ATRRLRGTTSVSSPPAAPDRAATEGGAIRARARGRPASGTAQHEVEAPVLAAIRLARHHQQIRAEEEVPPVARLARAVELGGEHPPAARLHLHVEVARAARVEPGDDGLEPVASVGVGALASAQPTALAGVPPMS